MVVLRGGINGGCDAAIVMTPLADISGTGTGLPARCAVGTRGNLRGPSVMLLRRVRAVSGRELRECVNGTDSGTLTNVRCTLTVDLKFVSPMAGAVRVNLYNAYGSLLSGTNTFSVREGGATYAYSHYNFPGKAICGVGRGKKSW